MKNSLLLSFHDYRSQGVRLAKALGMPHQEIAVHRFPDEESLVRLPPTLPERVVFCRSLDRPNHKLVELMLAARTARELGAKHLTLVAPYLCYMRQDIANQPGEAVSQRIVGAWLAELFDAVITVDPHLHRIQTLRQAIPLDQAIAVPATQPIGDFLHTRIQGAMLFGPDSEAEQWVARLAEASHCDYAVGSKIRHGDRSVDIDLPDIAFAGRKVVLIDDVASTGQTLATAARKLYAHGAKSVYACVTHAIFSPGAEHALEEANLKAVWSTDSVAHDSNVVSLDTLLAQTLLASLDA